jgi:molybdopterin-binding protein
MPRHEQRRRVGGTNLTAIIKASDVIVATSD